MRLNGKSTGDYVTALSLLVQIIKRDVPGFDFGHLRRIPIDFETALANAFRVVLGDEKANEVLQGCEVHFLRSCERMATRVSISDEVKQEFMAVAQHILKAKSKQSVLSLFATLMGDGVPPENVAPEAYIHWKRAKAWGEWFLRENVLSKYFLCAPGCNQVFNGIL